MAQHILSTLEEEVTKTKPDDHAINQNISVHQIGRRLRECREKRRQKRHAKVHNGYAVNLDTGLAHAELRGNERLFLPSCEEHARVGDDVRREQGAGAEGCNAVECNSAADIDHRQEDRNRERHDDGVEWDVTTRLYTGQEEVPERNAVIARECE